MHPPVLLIFLRYSLSLLYSLCQKIIFNAHSSSHDTFGMGIIPIRNGRILYKLRKFLSKSFDEDGKVL